MMNVLVGEISSVTSGIRLRILRRGIGLQRDRSTMQVRLFRLV